MVVVYIDTVVFLSVCILYLSNGEVEDYTKCELIGGGAPKHTFSNLFIVDVHYISIHAMYCF